MGNIQIRDVPPATHERLKALAAERSQSLNQLLLSEVSRLAPAVSVEDWLAVVRRHAPPVNDDPGLAARIIREARDEREARMADWGGGE